MEKAVMIVNPPTEDEPGKYMLIIHRPSSGFGDSPGIPIPVDSFAQLEEDDYAGYVAEEIVVRFPKTTPYILLPRKRIRFMDPLELTAEELVLRQEIAKLRRKAGDEDLQTSPPREVEGVSLNGAGTGQYL